MYKEENGITLIALVLTIIVLLILAGVSIAMLTGNNGILTQAQRAKELTDVSSEEEYINLLIIEHQMNNNTYGKELKKVQFNTLEDTTSIYDSETGTTYADGWYYLKPEDVNDYELKNSYIIDYDTGEFVRFDAEKHKVLTNELLCIKDGLVYSADPKNMTSSNSWGDAILHNFNKGDANSGWSENALMFDGIDDGIEVKDNSDYSQGITLEIYFNFKGKVTSDKIRAQILMMKRTNGYNGFFMFLDGDNWLEENLGKLYIDIGGFGSDEKNENRFKSNVTIQKNIPTYITYTYNPNVESDNGVLYINGIKTETTNLGLIENLINTPENTPIQIGSDIYETYNPEGDTSNRKYPFYGEIYASRVYNRPLTEKEVEYNYNMTVNNTK